jgi:hypothetical protein
MSFKRINFFRGLFMRAEDWTTEQNYHMEKHRLHTRAFHTPGIVTGGDEDLKESLKVSMTDTGVILVQPGYAVDGLGRDLRLPEGKELPLPSGMGNEKDKELYIYIGFEEEKTEPRESKLNPAERNEAIIHEHPKVGWTDHEPDNIEKMELARIKWRPDRRITREHINTSKVRYAGTRQQGYRVKEGKQEIPPSQSPSFTLDDDNVLIESFKDGRGVAGCVYVANVVPSPAGKATDARIAWRIEALLTEGKGLEYYLYFKNFGTENVNVGYEVYRLSLGHLMDL